METWEIIVSGWPIAAGIFILVLNHCFRLAYCSRYIYTGSDHWQDLKPSGCS
jgi:hypothetical protein